MEKGKVLEMNDYLIGLKKLFDKYNIQTVYTPYTFAFHGVREYGVWMCIQGEKGKPDTTIKEIQDYINFDGYKEDEEHYAEMSRFIQYYRESTAGLFVIYENGVFYEREGGHIGFK